MQATNGFETTRPRARPQRHTRGNDEVDALKVDMNIHYLSGDMVVKSSTYSVADLYDLHAEA